MKYPFLAWLIRGRAYQHPPQRPLYYIFPPVGLSRQSMIRSFSTWLADFTVAVAADDWYRGNVSFLVLSIILIKLSSLNSLQLILRFSWKVHRSLERMAIHVRTNRCGLRSVSGPSVGSYRATMARLVGETPIFFPQQRAP